MNVIKETFKGLVQRRLWPVAVALLAAVVAVPMLLAKAPATETPATAAPASAAKGEDVATFVSLSDDTATAKDRRVLGPAKDPFEPRALPKAKAAKKKTTAKTATAKRSSSRASSSSSPGGSGSAAAGSGAGPAATAVPTATPAPAPALPRYSIRVRIGTTDGAKATKTVQRLAVLPSVSEPVLVYRGVEQDGEIAVFELAGDVVAQGDGTCEPTPEDCQVLKLKAGDTEFMSVAGNGVAADAEYEIDLQKIYVESTASASSSALREDASVGRAVLSEWRQDRTTRYAFDPVTGTLRKVPAKAAKRLTLSSL